MLAIYIVNRGKDRIPRGKSSFKSCGNDFSLSSFHLDLAYQKFNTVEFSACATTDWKQWPVVNKCEYQTKIPKLLHSEPSRQSFVGDTFTISQILNLCSPRLLLFHETLSDNMGTAHIVDMSGKPSQEITWCLILVSNCLLWMTTKSFHFQVVTNMESSAVMYMNN